MRNPTTDTIFLYEFIPILCFYLQKIQIQTGQRLNELLFCGYCKFVKADLQHSIAPCQLVYVKFNQHQN